jgi:hypothetical protein
MSNIHSTTIPRKIAFIRSFIHCSLLFSGFHTAVQFERQSLYSGTRSKPRKKEAERNDRWDGMTSAYRILLLVLCPTFWKWMWARCSSETSKYSRSARWEPQILYSVYPHIIKHDGRPQSRVNWIQKTRTHPRLLHPGTREETQTPEP